MLPVPGSSAEIRKFNEYDKLVQLQLMLAYTHGSWDME